MKELLTVDQLCMWLSVERSWVYQRTFAGASDPLPFVKVGTFLRFEPRAIEQWLSLRQTPAEEEPGLRRHSRELGWSQIRRVVDTVFKAERKVASNSAQQRLLPKAGRRARNVDQKQVSK